MALEPLSCAHCGSGGVQEVKPDTYFCNYCEKVFKYVDSRRVIGPAGCQLLVNGRTCGVTAIGRCATDGSAFCPTHAARAAWPGSTPPIDKCRPCYEAEIAAARAHQAKFGQSYIQNTAPEELRAAGVPTIEVYSIETTYVRGFFEWEPEEHRMLYATGWLLGEFEWWPSLSIKGPLVLEDRNFLKKHPPIGSRDFPLLFLVRKESTGYGFRHEPGGLGHWPEYPDCIEQISRTIHRLAGT